MSGKAFFLIARLPSSGVFFIDRPFGYWQFFALSKRQSGEGALAKELVWIFRGIPILGQNAEGCTEEIQSNSRAFIGVAPGLPNFVQGIPQLPEGHGTGKTLKLHTKTREGQEPLGSH